MGSESMRVWDVFASLYLILRIVIVKESVR